MGFQVRFNIYRILELWNEHYSIPWWGAVLFCIAFSTVNIGIFVGFWLMRERVVLEFSCPNSKEYRKLEKKIQSLSLVERLLLIKTTKAGKMGVLLLINFLCHWMSILALLLSVIGFWGVILTHVDGWAFTIFIFPVILVTIITTLLELIPHYIYLPSIRRKYR